MNKTDHPLTIGHYQSVWLPGTMPWLYELVKGLEHHGRNIVLCDQTNKAIPFPVAELHSFDSLPFHTRFVQRIMRKTGMADALPYFVETVRNSRIKILHSHFGHMAYSGCRIAEAAGIPHVASFYGMDIRKIPNSDPSWRKRYHEMFSLTERVFCEGSHMARDIEQLGCPVDKITVHPLGIALDHIPFHPPQWDGSGPLHVLIAASFREKKGIPDALRAVAALTDRFDIRVTIIGDATSDAASQAEKTRIMETIREHQLHERVDIAGYRPHRELLKIAGKHHLFLSPSRHALDGDCEGGAPVSLIEMSAAGLMVVSTRHCDIPGVIIDEETGWLAEEDQLDDLVAKLETAINSRRNWGSIARRARKHIASRFDTVKQSENLYHHYQQIVT